MEEKSIQPEESMAIIQDMISAARNKLADDGFYFILWGWLIFSASIIFYASEKLGVNQGAYIWPVLIGIGIVASIFYGRNQKKREQVRTHLDSYLGYLWVAFIVAMFAVLMFMGVHGLKPTYFFLMILYGMATFISGGMLRFRPLIIGGILALVCAISSVFISEEHQMLILAASLLMSYIIPGHLLQSKFKSEQIV